VTDYDRRAYDDVDERLRAERRKAIDKYGPNSLAPGGDPSRDVLDYAINEITGLMRYGEMIISRAQDYPDGLRAEAVELGRSIRSFGERTAVRAAALRLAAIDAGANLGDPESQ
jgi:hypothetical protein